MCFVLSAPIVIPVSVGATDSSSSNTKAAKAVGDQAPEQAAGGRENPTRLQQVAEADAKRCCKGVAQRGGRIIKCLWEHEYDLATDCAKPFRMFQRHPKDGGEVGQSFGGTQFWA